MDPAIRALLESADDPIHAEDDQKVEWEEMNERVSGLLPKLERITGQTFDLDDGVQDATYWGELAIWRSSADTPEWGEVLEAVFAVRFSNFGWLFTAWGRHPTERLPEAQVEEVIQAVSYAGFQHIPTSALDEPYTGSHPAFAGATWWHRFFDYV